MFNYINKKLLNIFVVVALSFLSFYWSFYVFHIDFDLDIVLVVIVIRLLSSRFILKDYNLSWSRVS
jgi:UDP-N-acetyl-D-glucosamine 4,6-dehydratase